MATKKKMVKVSTFSLVRDVAEQDKCPPQARAIVKVIRDLGGKATKEQVLEGLAAPGLVETNQTIERILGFYRPRLIEMGVLSEDVKEVELEVEVVARVAKPKVEKAPKAPKAEKLAVSTGAAQAGTPNPGGSQAEAGTGGSGGIPRVDPVKDQRGTAKSA